MKVLELPQLRATGDIVAVVIERSRIGTQPLAIVTVRESVSRPPHRRWRPEEAAAIAYAGEQADRHGLPLFDLREPGEIG
jgi:hypothetical protein